MTIPELPIHRRYKMIDGELCFLTADHQEWVRIDELRVSQYIENQLEFESCVAIARCWFQDLSADHFRFAAPTMENPHSKKIDSKAGWEAIKKSDEWKLYGESRK